MLTDPNNIVESGATAQNPEYSELSDSYLAPDLSLEKIDSSVDYQAGSSI